MKGREEVNQISEELEARVNRMCGFNMVRSFSVITVILLVALAISLVVYWNDLTIRSEIFSVLTIFAIFVMGCYAIDIIGNLALKMYFKRKRNMQ